MMTKNVRLKILLESLYLVCLMTFALSVIYLSIMDEVSILLTIIGMIIGTSFICRVLIIMFDPKSIFKSSGPDIKDSENTGTKIERGMCWRDNVSKYAIAINDDKSTKEVTYDVAVFCIALAFDGDKWTLMLLEADDLSIGDGEWRIVHYYHKNLPEDVKLVDQIDGNSIYRAFFDID